MWIKFLFHPNWWVSHGQRVEMPKGRVHCRRVPLEWDSCWEPPSNTSKIIELMGLFSFVGIQKSSYILLILSRWLECYVIQCFDSDSSYLVYNAIYQALCVYAPGIMKFLIVLNGVYLFRSDFSWWEEILLQRCLYRVYVQLKSPQSVQ